MTESIIRLTSRDTLTLTRQVEGTQTSTGAKSISYTTAGRGSLPTSWVTRADEMTAEEMVKFGVQDRSSVWKFLGATNPSLDVQDRVTWTDQDDVSRTAQIIKPSRNLDGQGRLYMAMGEIVGNES